MNFNSLLIIKFNELYIFILKNIKQKHVFNTISISLNVVSNLNHLIIITQCFEFTTKLSLKLLTLLMILTKINNIKTLMKTIKTMIFIMIVIMF